MVIKRVTVNTTFIRDILDGDLVERLHAEQLLKARLNHLFSLVAHTRIISQYVFVSITASEIILGKITLLSKQKQFPQELSVFH